MLRSAFAMVPGQLVAFRPIATLLRNALHGLRGCRGVLELLGPKLRVEYR